ncbi:7336_t:CDS:2, partial [Gigaspora margarita]
MYPTMALLQQQITGTSQPEKCINKGSNNEIIEKLTGLMKQIAISFKNNNSRETDNRPQELYQNNINHPNRSYRQLIIYNAPLEGDYIEVENNEANEENANKDDKPRKL